MTAERRHGKCGRAKPASALTRAVERQMDRLTWQKRALILVRGMAMGALLLAAGYGLAKWEDTGWAAPSVLREAPSR